jgi:type IV pilus secretin PilQ/predicted competence protein
MRSAYPERVYYKWLVLAAAALALWGVGYHSDTLTTAGLTAGGSIAHAQETADAPARITGITVSRQEQDTQVTISGSRPLTYTVVKLQSPLKILVDIPDCTMEKTMGPGGIDSDLVSEVTSQALQKGERIYLRVEIALKKDVTYTVNAELSDLVIRMTGIGVPAATAEQEEPEASPEPAAAPPAVREGQIVDLEIRTDDVGLTVVADDMINTYNTIQLDDPVRLVIDIPGVKDQLEKKVYSLQSSLVDKVKVGQHPGKVRFAIYFKGKMPAYTIQKDNNKLLVLWNGAAPAAQAAVAKDAAAEEPVTAARIAGPADETEEGLEDEKDKVYTGQKISLDFKDADVRNILRLIADVSGLNIIVSDNVKGKVTIKLDNVPWDEVLDIILETNNLGKVWSKSVMRIETQEDIRRISDDQYKALKSREKVADLQTVVMDIIYRDAKDVAKLLEEEKELSSERGIITVDPNLNRLVVTDTPEKIAMVKERIARYDDRTVRQVFIEARIVQSIPTYTKEIGIQWGGPYSTTGEGGKTVYGVAGASGVEFEREEVTDPVTGLTTELVNVLGGPVIDLPAAVGLGAGGGIGFGILRDNLELTATLTALEKDEKVKIISNPRVLSIDKNEALIKQGVALPYLKLSEEGVTSTEFKDAVLELKVTPTILSEKIIKIDLRVKKDQKSAQTGAGGEPGIDIREAQTVLMVESGRTVVIGGIYEETTNIIRSGVPFFADIPGLGRMFRNDFNKKELTELLIFVTTTIVPREIVGSDA